MAIIAIIGVLLDGTTTTGTPRRPTVQNIDWPKGEDGTIAITVVGANGAAIDITGNVIGLYVRRRYDDEAVTLARAGTITAGPAGTAAFTINAADTAALALADYSYDVHLVQTGSKRRQVVPASTFRIMPAIGRADDELSGP